MRRKRANCTDLCTEVKEAGHNSNKLLDLLAAERSLQLPTELNLSPIALRERKTERKSEASMINQVWRYGGCLISEGKDDKAIEAKLKRISEWIKQELR